jgi:type I restriction enzyme S subunit
MPESGWTDTRLGDLVPQERPICYGVLKPGEYVPGGVPLVRIVDLVGNGVRHESLYRITDRLDEEFARSRLEGGEVLLSIQGTIGRVALASQRLAGANISRTIARIALSPEAHAGFLRQWMLSEVGQKVMADTVVGTTRASLNIGDLRELSVPVPPHPQQRQIAEILDTIDEAIRKTEAIIAKLKQVKQGLLHDLLTRGIDDNGELRDLERHPEQFKDSPLGQIPKVWATVCLGDVLSVRLGFAFRSEDYDHDGILNYRVANIGRDLRDFGEVTFLPRLFWDRHPNQRLTGGEIVLVMVGATTGKLGRVPVAVCPALQNQNMWNLIPTHGVDRDFLWYMLPDAVERHMALAQGSARDFLTQKSFLPTPCVRPTISEQKRIVLRARALESRIGREQVNLRKLRLVKQGLMADLLTGRVRVANLLETAAE